MRPGLVRAQVTVCMMIFGSLLSVACGSGPTGVMTPADGDGPADVAGHHVAAPTNEPLAPFEVKLGDVHIEEETPATPDPNAAPSVDGESTCSTLRFGGPTFASNEIVLSDDGRRALDVLLGRLTEQSCTTGAGPCRHNDVRVMLTGHTDDQPTSAPGGNLQLSKDRARAVAAVFIEHGFMDVHANGRADTEPAQAPVPDTRTVQDVRAANRRVTIDIFCQ